MFCTDTDLLRWEPTIAADAAFSSQTLLSTTGTISGTTLTLDSGSFTAAHVLASFVACVTGAVNGCFPIVSIDSSTTCTLSAMYDGVDATPPLPVSPGAASDLAVVVRSFYPQRRIITDLLMRMAGIEHGSTAQIVNTGDFRIPCALGTLHLIYNAMSTASFDNHSELIVRAELYQRLYRKALRDVVAEIDTDGDGIANCRRALRIVHFARL